MQGGLRIWLLGGFRAERDGVPIPDTAWERPTARALVKLLAVQSSHRLHREQIMEALWPELAPESALQSFRNALSRARKALDPQAGRTNHRFLRLAGDLVEFDAASVAVDIDAFTRVAAEALAVGSVEALTQATEAYGGELLPEDRFEDWATLRRDELAVLYGRVAGALIDALEERGRYREAISRAEELLRTDATQEELHRRLIRLHLLTGSRHRALQQYQACRTTLEQELGVEPDEETEALHQEILALGSQRAAPSLAFALPRAVVQAGNLPFVGRATALESLLQSVDALRAGRGSAVLVSGEPGVGKTRLVAQAALRASQSGVRVLWGAGYGAPGGLPYAPFVEAIETAVSTLPEERKAALAQQYPEIAQIVPSLQAHRMATTVPAGDLPRFFAGIARLLAELADEGPLLLVLDDLHAIDRASVQLLDHLMGAAGRHPWLILGTFRIEDVEENSGFGDLWTKAVRNGVCSRIGLLRLSSAETTQLVRDLLGAADVDETLIGYVGERSLGNPLFIAELVQALREGGAIARKGGRWVLQEADPDAVPRGVRDLIGRRVARMEGTTQAVLHLAAVAAADVRFALLRDAAGLADLPTLDALDRAIEARVLLEAGEGYGFAHPLFGEAIYAGLTTSRRRYLHGALATTLEQQTPDEVEALAYHFRRAGEEERSITYLEKAGDRARAVFANELAAQNYREVVAWLEAHDRRRDAANVRRKLADVYRTVSQFADAVDVLEPARALWEELGEIESLVAVTGEMGTMLRGLGRIDEGFALLAPLRADAERLTSFSAAARYFLALAQLHRVRSQDAESHAAAHRASESARAGGDDFVLGQALVVESLAIRSWREKGIEPFPPELTLDHSTALMEEAGRLFERMGEPRGEQLVMANLAAFAQWAGHFGRAAELYDELAVQAERVGNPAQFARWRASRGWMLRHLGEPERALADLRQTIELSRRLDKTYSSVYPAMFLGGTLVDLGRWEEAEEALTLADSLLLEDGDRSNERIILGHRATALLDRGRPHDALALLTEYLDRDGGDGTFDLLPFPARVYAECGDLDAAARLNELVIARHEQEGVLNYLVEHLVVKGQILLLRGDVPGAEEVLERARSMAAAMPYPYIVGQAIFLLATAPDLPADRATDLLRQALAIFERIGAGPYIDRAREALESVRVRAPAGELR